MHESYSYLSVTHTLSQWGNSVWGPIITVWCLLVSILYLFFPCLSSPAPSAPPSEHPQVVFYFGVFFPVEEKSGEFDWEVSPFLGSFFLFFLFFSFFFFFFTVKGCKREVKQAGMKFQSSVLVNTFTGFQLDLLPAISTFSNVTCCLLGKNKPPYCKGASKISDNISLWAHTDTQTHTHTHVCTHRG